MKDFFKFLVLILVSGAVLSSCKKDDFTEEDALEALQKVSLQISVHDASDSDAPISGATVKAVIDTTVVSAITSSNGVAVFENINIGGDVSIYTTLDNYTKSFTTVNTTPRDYRQTVINGHVYLYALSGPNITTVKGQLTVESNLTNRQRETVSNVEVIAYNNDLEGNVRRYYIDTTDASGNYSIAMPVDGDEDEIFVHFPTLELQRTAGVVTDNIYSVETVPALYMASDYAESAVEQVPSALVTIAAPPTQGSGLELGTELVADSLTNQITDVDIINGGNGYGTGAANENITYDFNTGTGGTAQITFNVQDGVINSYVSLTNNSARYTTKPSISLTGGSGAVIQFQYRRRYKVILTSGGSDYLVYPKVGAKYFRYNNTSIEQEIDNDITVSSEISTPELFDNTEIVDGVITGKNDRADSLFTTNYLYGDSLVFLYRENTNLPSKAYINSGSINSDGTLSGGYIWLATGEGYDPEKPPVVTVTGLAGYGTGAMWEAEVNFSGNMNQIIMIKEGNGFVDDINDYDGDENYTEAESASLIGFSTWGTGYGRHDNVKPGMTYIGDVFYGTGMVKNR